MTIMLTRDEPRQQITLIERELAPQWDPLADPPLPEPYGRGSVIRFRHGGFDYAAIRTQDGMLAYWYVTQASVNVPPKTWDSLLDWIGADNWNTLEVLA